MYIYRETSLVNASNDYLVMEFIRVRSATTPYNWSYSAKLHGCGSNNVSVLAFFRSKTSKDPTQQV